MEDAEFIKYIRHSKKIEWEICQWYKENIDPSAHLPKVALKGYDIICPRVGNVEVKEDKIAVKSDKYALEIEDAQGEPSGLKATTAGEFVLVDDEFVSRIKTTSLGFVLKECIDEKVTKLIQMGYTTQDGRRAWGYLIPRNKILYSPYTEVVKRWFP